MDTPQNVASNGIIALVFLTCATPFLLTALAVLWLGPAHWPVSVRRQWEKLPERARWVLVRIQPVLWLIIGLCLGSSLLNPLARWLRMLMP